MAASRKSLSKLQQASARKSESPQRKQSPKESDTGSPARPGKQTQSPGRKTAVKEAETDVSKKVQSPRRKAVAAEAEGDGAKKSVSPARKSASASAKEPESLSAVRKTQSPQRKGGGKETESSAVKKTQSPLRKSGSKDADSAASKHDTQTRGSAKAKEVGAKGEPPDRGKSRPQSARSQPSQRGSAAAPGLARKTKKGSGTVSDKPSKATESIAPLPKDRMENTAASSEPVKKSGIMPSLPDPHPSSDPPLQASASSLPSVLSSDVVQDSETPLDAGAHPSSSTTVCVCPSASNQKDQTLLADTSKSVCQLDTVHPVLEHAPSDMAAAPLPVLPQTVSSFVSAIKIDLETPAAASEDSDTDSASSDGAGTVKEVEHNASQKPEAVPLGASRQPVSYTPAEKPQTVLSRVEVSLQQVSLQQPEREVFEDVIEEDESEVAEEEMMRSGSEDSYPGRGSDGSFFMPHKLDVSDIPREASDPKTYVRDLSQMSSPHSPSPSPRLHSNLTSTPNRKRAMFHRRSWTVRPLNLSQEPAFEDEELSLSSSEFSNCSLDRSRIDELSDDGSLGENRVRDTAEFTDEQPDIKFTVETPVPINKQLRIVTSVDRALNPRRRSSSLSSKPDRVLCLGRSSSENLEHVVFLDFLKKHGMSAYLGCFPPSMTMSDFRMVTEEELMDVYGVTDSEGRRQLMRGVEMAREESDTDMESSVELGGGIGPTSPLPSPLLRKCRDDLPFSVPSSLRRLHRTLSEDTKQKRQESMPSSPTLTQPPPPISHSVSALIEPTNLLRMRNSALGQSAPSLTNSLKDPLVTRRSNRNNRRSVVATNTSPTLSHRCPSPQMPGAGE
ncbi:hypothetical protein ACOMHN_004010 [Nucella lapillus]